MKRSNQLVSAIAERACSARKEAKLTRPEAADLACIPYTTLVNIERGAVKRSAQFPRLAAIYGVNALWLETGNGPRRSRGAPDLSAFDPIDERENRLLAIFRTAPDAVRTIILEHAESLAKLTRKSRI